MNGSSSTKFAKLAGSKEWGKKSCKEESMGRRSSVKRQMIRDQKENG